MQEANYALICEGLLEDLSERQKEVIQRRFGLTNNQEQETLQAIGDYFSVTRERIRQIQNDALKELKKKVSQDTIQAILADFQGALKQEGGLKREDLFLQGLAKNGTKNQVRFLLIIGNPFYYQTKSEHWHSFWALEPNLITKAKQGIRLLSKKLKKEQKPITTRKALEYLGFDNPKTSVSILEIAKNIEKGPLGRYGLIHWPEIKPKGARDQAYLALKKEGHPLHFTKIAEVANIMLASSSINNTRKVLPQTVHNELIRDPRFVLVGRGMYALREWGYREGTVKDIIKQTLKQTNQPLSQEEIMEQVLSQRFVEKNTVLLSLKDRKEFIRDSQGNYILKNG